MDGVQVRAFSLLVCRDMPEGSTDVTAPWLADLGDRKYAALHFATESERTQVAMEALNLGYRVQFTTLDEFEHISGVAEIKRLCTVYHHGDSGADNPTAQAEYESWVAGELISTLEDVYQFQAFAQ